MDNPCTSWLADAYWDNITELDKLTNFHGLMNSFEQYPRDWHLWYTHAAPEKAMLPGTRHLYPTLTFCFPPPSRMPALPVVPHPLSQLVPASWPGAHSRQVPCCLDSPLFQTHSLSLQ